MLNEILEGLTYLLTYSLEQSTETWNGLPIWLWVLIVIVLFTVFAILDRAFDPEPEDEVARQLWLQRKQDLFKH